MSTPILLEQDTVVYIPVQPLYNNGEVKGFITKGLSLSILPEQLPYTVDIELKPGIQAHTDILPLYLASDVKYVFECKVLDNYVVSLDKKETLFAIDRFIVNRVLDKKQMAEMATGVIVIKTTDQYTKWYIETPYVKGRKHGSVKWAKDPEIKDIDHIVEYVDGNEVRSGLPSCQFSIM
jgi:hypothetical protein